MENKKPIILCVRTLLETRVVINKAYASAIEKAGGILVMVASDNGEEDLEDLLENVDGILIPGGTDVNPSLYEEKREEYTQDSDNYKDIIESFLIERALEKKLPILAICRGIQILNVKLGGSLCQDVEKEIVGSIKHDRHNDGPRSLLAHKVFLEENSLIKKIIGLKEIEVNSLHHQGIKTVSKELTISARSPDGLVEGLEMPSYPFLLGLQWHPEELDNPLWKKVFDSFITASGNK